MGFEYEIRFADANTKYTVYNIHAPTPEAIHKILQDAPHLDKFDEAFGHYEYRWHRGGGKADMPDAHASVKEHGIYVCFNVSPPESGNELFDYLIYKVLDMFSGLEIVADP